MNDQALSLKQAAEVLQMSYKSVYRMRHQLAFRIGRSQWRVWRSTLESLQPEQKCGNLKPLSARGNGDDKKCQSTSTPNQACITLKSQRQTEQELDALLAPKNGKPRKSITTR